MSTTIRIIFLVLLSIWTNALLAADKPLPPTLMLKSIEFVLVPAGVFEMGSTKEEAFAAFKDANLRSAMLEDHVFVAEGPKHTIYLDAYYISKYELTNAQYRAFVNETGRKPPIDPDTKQSLWETPDFSHPDQPVVGVNWFDALAFCKWLGAELPTEAQWEKAARGPGRQKYPWGSAFPSRKMAAFSKYVPSPCRIGSYPKNVSPYGAMDMAGNVFEWCRDEYDAGFYRRSPHENPVNAGRLNRTSERSIRGGAYDYGTPFLRSALRMRLPAHVSFRNLGFRVVYTP